MVTNYPGHIMQDHTDAYIIGKLDSILTYNALRSPMKEENMCYLNYCDAKFQVRVLNAIRKVAQGLQFGLGSPRSPVWVLNAEYTDIWRPQYASRCSNLLSAVASPMMS